MSNFITKYWYEFVALLKKDYFLLLRRKKYLYLALAFPLILSLIYIFTIAPTNSILDIGLCDYDQTAETANLRNNIRDFRVQIMKEENCTNELIEKIKSGKIVFGLEIPKGFTNELANLRQGKIISYKDNSDISMANYADWKVGSAILVYKRQIIDSVNMDLKKEVTGLNVQVKSASKVVDYAGSDRLNPLKTDLMEIERSLTKIEGVSTNFIVNPIYIESRGVYDIQNILSTGLTFIFPIIALFVLLLLVSTNIIFDKKTNFLSRIKASKTSNLMYLVSKLVFFLGLTFVQFFVVLLIFLLKGATFSPNYFSLLGVIVLIGLTDTLLAILVGLFSDSEGIAVLISLLLTLPFMFLSGIFYPLNLLPKFLQWISFVFPLNTQIFLMKKTILFSQAIQQEIFYLFGALFIVCWFYLGKK